MAERAERKVSVGGDTLLEVRGLKRYFDVSPPWLNRVLEGKPDEFRLLAVEFVAVELEFVVVAAVVVELHSISHSFKFMCLNKVSRDTSAN